MKAVRSLIILMLAFVTWVSATTFTVNTTLDEFTVPSGVNISLREAMRDAADAAGLDTITFAPVLAGKILTFTAEIEVADTNGVTIDASSLPGGVTISGGGETNRLFTVANGMSLALQALTFTGWKGGSTKNGSGGVIYSQGTLTLTDCTFTGNSAEGVGGAIVNEMLGTLTAERCTFTGNSTSGHLGGGTIANAGTMALTECTISGNYAAGPGGAIMNVGALKMARCTVSSNSATIGYGGAIYNLGSLTLTHCTLAGNVVGIGGGAIYNSAPAALSLTHCTITGNRASGYGGAIYNVTDIPLTLARCIVAGNTAGTGADIYNHFGSVIRVGANIVQSHVNTPGEATDSGPVINADPLLSPLGSYGGPTPTVALLPGSPARNAAVNSTATNDQRGFPIVGTPDLGAYETGTPRDYDTWAWETFPAGATAAQRTAAYDYDDDGRSNAFEYAVLSNPLATDPRPLLTFTANAAFSAAIIRFPVRDEATDLGYKLERSFDFTAWTLIAAHDPVANVSTSDIPGLTLSREGAVLTVSDPGFASQSKFFYRLVVDLAQ